MFKCRLRTRLLRCSQQAFLFTVNQSLSLCGTRLHCVLLLGMSSMVTGGERKWLCERSLTLVKVDALVRTTLCSVQLRSRSRLSELNCCLTKGVLKRPGSSIWNLKWRKHTVALHYFLEKQACTVFRSADEGFASEDLHPCYVIFINFFLRHIVYVHLIL